MVREVKLQGRNRDKAVVNRLKIGAVVERVLNRVETEPKIPVATRVFAFDDAAA